MASGINLARLMKATTIRDIESSLGQDGLQKSEVNKFVTKAIAEQAITLTSAMGEFENSPIVIDEVALEKLLVPTHSSEVFGNKSHNEVVSAGSAALVYTAPTRLIPSCSTISGLTTETVLKNLLRNSRSRVLMISPFLEREGIYSIRTELLAAFRKGVSFKLLTRSVEDNNLALPLNDLFQILGGKLQARSFHSQIHRSRESWKQIESTHAKLFLVDDEQMYVGSAELRLNALFSNFELGLLVKDNMLVKQAAALFEIFWNDKLYTKPIDELTIQSILSRSVS